MLKNLTRALTFSPLFLPPLVIFLSLPSFLYFFSLLRGLEAALRSNEIKVNMNHKFRHIYKLNKKFSQINCTNFMVQKWLWFGCVRNISFLTSTNIMRNTQIAFLRCVEKSYLPLAMQRYAFSKVSVYFCLSTLQNEFLPIIETKTPGNADENNSMWRYFHHRSKSFCFQHSTLETERFQNAPLLKPFSKRFSVEDRWKRIKEECVSLVGL